MPPEDIYGNKRRYERFIKNLDQLLRPGEPFNHLVRRKYFCRVPENLKYFRKLHRCFGARDTSFPRRNRLMSDLLFLCHHATSPLDELDRDDIDLIVAQGHKVNTTVHSKQDYIKNLRFIWKLLLPAKDEKGRPDENLVPYVVGHLRPSVDVSREVRRRDKLTPREFNRLLVYFSCDPMMQAYLALALESLGRPQEICYTKVGDVDLSDRYARVWVSSHGKEGVKFLQSVDSFPYLMRWLSVHPYRSDEDSYLFITTGQRHRPLTPFSINQRLRLAVRRLGIKKPVTAYSLKRNGVTFRRLRGEPDVVIQHTANWSSTRQLHTYDLSSPEDTFKQSLADRGLASPQTDSSYLPRTLDPCECGCLLAYADMTCPRCHRPIPDPKSS